MWTPDRHPYAIANELRFQDEAILGFGELSIFVLFWSIYDHERGDVDRCPTCWTATNGVAEAYGQASRSRCSDCFGTSFEGGARAIVYRPALWATDSTTEGPQKRGVITSESAQIQSVSTFTARQGDLIARADGTRWRIGRAEAAEFTTGFGNEDNMPTLMRALFTANLVDTGAPMFDIPLDLAPLISSGGWNPRATNGAHPSDVVNGALDYDTVGQ